MTCTAVALGAPPSVKPHRREAPYVDESLIAAIRAHWCPSCVRAGARCTARIYGRPQRRVSAGRGIIGLRSLHGARCSLTVTVRFQVSQEQ